MRTLTEAAAEATGVVVMVVAHLTSRLAKNAISVSLRKFAICKNADIPIEARAGKR